MTDYRTDERVKAAREAILSEEVPSFPVGYEGDEASYWRDRYERLAMLPDVVAAVSGHTAWVIVAYAGDESMPWYFRGDADAGDQSNWSKNHETALRFSRRQDADVALRFTRDTNQPGRPVVEEHSWAAVSGPARTRGTATRTDEQVNFVAQALKAFAHPHPNHPAGTWRPYADAARKLLAGIADRASPPSPGVSRSQIEALRVTTPVIAGTWADHERRAHNAAIDAVLALSPDPKEGTP